MKTSGDPDRKAGDRWKFQKYGSLFDLCETRRAGGVSLGESRFICPPPSIKRLISISTEMTADPGKKKKLNCPALDPVSHPGAAGTGAFIE